MFDVLSDGFSKAKSVLSGKTKLTEENVSEAIKLIRTSLLEADVEYSVAKNFLSKVKEEVIGQQVGLKAGKGKGKLKVSAGDHFVQICQKQLEDLMGPVDTSIKFAKNGPSTIMMVGLQGSGKTTHTGKLAKMLMDQKKKPLLVAADIYRPAAVEQLKVLGSKIGVPVFHKKDCSPVEICSEGLKKATELGCDVVFFDTAGRLTVDEELMQELVDIKSTSKPDNILFVCDAMMGQDAVTTAKAFNDRLDFSGVVMTKLDGDARGGAALSIKEITTKPIKYLGMGEGLEALEEFRPEGLASRILGLGDIVGLMQDFDKVSDKDREEDAMRMLQGQFSFNDFYEQISMIQKMGSLKDVMAKMPMQGMIPKDANMDDSELTKIKAMIDSMTIKERLNPELFNDSRMSRIAKGSGRKPKDVKDLLEKFKQMRQMMGMMGKSMGMMGKIPGMGAMKGLNQMRKMAGGGLPGMGGGGGMPSMSDMAALMGGGGAGNGATKKAPVDKDKLRKARKKAKDARKKNRKR